MLIKLKSTTPSSVINFFKNIYLDVGLISGATISSKICGSSTTPSSSLSKNVTSTFLLFTYPTESRNSSVISQFWSVVKLTMLSGLLLLFKTIILSLTTLPVRLL